MNSWLVLFFFPHYINMIPVGFLRNISLTLLTPTFSNIMNSTRQECLCAMMGSSNISALNYFSNNTCQLFSNVSVMSVNYSWTPNVNALFYFLSLPTKAAVSVLSVRPSVLSSQYKPTTVDISTRAVQTSAGSTKTLALTTTAATVLPQTVAGTGVLGSSMNQLNAPNDIFLTLNGTLYVADYFNNRIQIFGSTNTTAIFSQGGMTKPITVRADNASNYYVIESVIPTNRVSKWPLNQTVLTLFNAYGLAIDNEKNLYISTLNGAVIFWNATSHKNTTIVPVSEGLSSPRHIHLDEEKQALYIADSGNNRIVKFPLRNGSLTVVAGGHGIGTAANQLNFPAGVCVSKLDGTIYVADTNNHRVQKWIANGTVGQTILGNANGIAASGLFGLYHPYSIALDTTETFLYVADSDNNRVQRIPIS